MKYEFQAVCDLKGSCELSEYEIIVDNEEVKSLKIAYQVAITKAFEKKLPDERLVSLCYVVGKAE